MPRSPTPIPTQNPTQKQNPSQNPSQTQTKPRVATEKATIPKALREQVWIEFAGRVFQRKCLIPWCANTMTVFDFHVGHDVPESQGGATDISNLRPICARCNLSMGSQYTVRSWAKLSTGKRTLWQRLLCRPPSSTLDPK